MGFARITGSLLCLLALAQTGLAVEPWLDVGKTHIYFRVDGEPAVVPDDVLIDIANSGSTAELAGDLTRALARRERFRDIVIEERPPEGGQEKTVLLVSAHASPLVRAVVIQGVDGDALPASRLRGFIEVREGRRLPDVEWIARDAQRLQAGIRERGFPAAVVNGRPVPVGPSKIDVEFLVRFGRPCLIADFVPLKERHSGFQGIQYGDLCDVGAVGTAIRDEETRLRNQGFINARLYVDPKTALQTSEDGTRASLRYWFERGGRWELQVLTDPGENHLETDFASATGFVLGDLAFLSREELRTRILGYLRRQGYVDARVSQASVRRAAGGVTQLVYQVSPGPQILIDYEATVFRGDLPGTREDALDELGLRPSLLSLSARVPYVEEDLPAMRSTLRDMFDAQGYLNAQVADPEVFRQPGLGTVRLEFATARGPRFVIRSVAMAGLPKDMEQSVVAERDLLKAGSPVSPAEIDNFVAQVRNQLAARGYRRPEIERPATTCTPPEVAAEGPAFLCTPEGAGIVQVDLRLRVKPGPLFRVGDISVDSVPFDKGERVLAESELTRGEPLVVERTSDARERILRHGLFGNVVLLGADSIEVAPEEASRAEVRRDITVLATRPETWNLTLNPSYNTTKGYVFNGEFRRNNLTHDGLQLFLQGTVAQEHHQRSTAESSGQRPGYSVSANLREPFTRFGNWVSPFDFNFITLSYAFDVRDEQRDVVQAQSDITWRPRWYGLDFLHKLELSYMYSGYRYRSEISEPKKIIDHSNDIDVVELQWTSRIDTRDSPVWPRNGILLSLQAGHSGPELGSESAYERYAGELGLFAGLTRKWSAAFSVGGRRITSVRSPGSRRETLSSLLVRGFSTSDEVLGPLLWEREGETNTLHQIPATSLFFGRSEFRLRDPLSNWGWVFFFDTATAYIRDSEARRLSEELGIPAEDADDPRRCSPYQRCILGNDPVTLRLQQAGFLKSYWDSSYKSAGFGLRYLIGDMFALTLDWGIPIADPAGQGEGCLSYADVVGKPSPAELPACINRRPSWLRDWNSAGNIRHNAFEMLKHTYISIEGRL